MNNKIYSQSISNFRIIALVVMSVITFAGIADAQITGKTQQGIKSKSAINTRLEKNLAFDLIRAFSI